MVGRLDEALFRCTRETYGNSFNTDLLEQYKLYVQSAENVSARRVASSRYLLTLNVALFALYGFQAPNLGPGCWTVLVSILGFSVSVLWCQIIKSHKNLNAVKFEIIHKLERCLPVALYSYEWRLAEEGRGKPYRSVTDIEQWIPRAFLALHLTLLLARAYRELLNYIGNLAVSSG